MPKKERLNKRNVFEGALGSTFMGALLGLAIKVGTEVRLSSDLSFGMMAQILMKNPAETLVYAVATGVVVALLAEAYARKTG